MVARIASLLRITRRAALFAAVYVVGTHGAAAADDALSRQCSSLQSLASPSLTLSVSSLQPKGRIQGDLPTEGIGEMPRHCLVRGVIEPRTGLGGRAYGVGFEVRMPDNWNGRFLFQGGGGLDGRLVAAVGPPGPSGSTSPPALARGFAVVSMDGGHHGTDASFAIDQQAKLDYAFQAIGKVTRVAKQVITTFYGKAPNKSYFVGCSNGGREAMIGAQRYPTEFDGVVALDPAFNLGPAVLLATHVERTLANIAPKGPTGQPALAKALTADEWSLLANAILKSCDALDGVRDGMIFNHAACRFDPAELQCRKNNASPCLTADKVAAIATAFAGPRDATGNTFVSSWPYDGGVGTPGWQMWQTGLVMPDGTSNSMFISLIGDTRDHYFQYPPATLTENEQPDYPKLLAAMEPTTSATDPISTQLTSFAQRGGKLLLLTGWSDPIFSANDLVTWYERLQKDSQAAQQPPAENFSRLFLVPGMNHCGGGPALDDIDPLQATVDWVEQGTAPNSLLARGKAFAGQSRPICAYPGFARYDGKGDASQASSYACAVK